MSRSSKILFSIFLIALFKYNFLLTGTSIYCCFIHFRLANLAQPAPASAGVINSNINLNLGRSNTYQTSINMSNNNYNNGRLYGGGYTGASEKMLMVRNQSRKEKPSKESFAYYYSGISVN